MNNKQGVCRACVCAVPHAPFHVCRLLISFGPMVHSRNVHAAICARGEWRDSVLQFVLVAILCHWSNIHINVGRPVVVLCAPIERPNERWRQWFRKLQSNIRHIICTNERVHGCAFACGTAANAAQKQIQQPTANTQQHNNHHSHPLYTV